MTLVYFMLSQSKWFPFRFVLYSNFYIYNWLQVLLFFQSVLNISLIFPKTHRKDENATFSYEILSRTDYKSTVTSWFLPRVFGRLLATTATTMMESCSNR